MPAQSRRLNWGFWAILAVLALVLAGSPVQAEQLRIIPVPPNTVPQWAPLPELPQVSYAPNLPTDVFKLQGRYFLYWAGAWYQSRKIKGPWMRLEEPPEILSQIKKDYFKMSFPQRDGVLLTPEGKVAEPPPPVPDQPGEEEDAQPPATEAYAPRPPEPLPQESAPPLLPSEEGQPRSPLKPLLPPAPEKTAPPTKGAQPVEPDTPADEPEDQDAAPLSVPKGDMPKVM